MISLQITDLRKITELLFVSDAFDRFLLHDASFATAFSLDLDGRKNPAFYSEEEREQALKTGFVPWSELRPLCLSVLKGKKLPVSFRIVLLTPPESTVKMQAASGFTDCGVSSLSLNIIYRDNTLFMTSGVAYKGFSMDKSLELYWDNSVRAFLSGRQCAFTEC